MALFNVTNPIVSTSAGHGMNTYGKETPPLPQRNYQRMKEKEFNEAVQKYLHTELTRCGIKHVDVDHDTLDVALSVRANRVDASGSQLHIDIHANAFNGVLDDKAGGIETYYYEHSSKSKQVAQIVHKHIMKGTKMKDRGLKHGAWLYMIKNVKPVSILVELGFMDNEYDVAHLLSDAYRRECAKELAMAVCEVFGRAYVPEPAPKKEPSKGAVTVDNAGVFKDVSKDRSTHEAIEHLKTIGVFNGYPDGTFKPTQPITREQVASVLSRTINYLEEKSRG